jgi:hypothetical protein
LDGKTAEDCASPGRCLKEAILSMNRPESTRIDKNIQTQTIVKTQKCGFLDHSVSDV